MRKLASLAALALSVSLSSATHSMAADEFVVEIVRPAALKKDELFTQSVLWMAESFRSSREVIELKDKDLGTIIGNGAMDVDVSVVSFLPVTMPVLFKLRIDFKDGRYRMTLYNVKLIVSGGQQKPIEDANRESMEPKVRARFEEMANSLDAYLTKPRKDF